MARLVPSRFERPNLGLLRLFDALRCELTRGIYRSGRVLFDHVPKSAGTTIRSYLASHYPRRYIFETRNRSPSESVRAFRALPEGARYRYELILGHRAHELLDRVHPDTIAFTVLREPVDRIVSHYHYVKRDPSNYLHDRVVAGGIRLADYAGSGISGELRNRCTTQYSGLSIEEAEKDPDASVRRALDTLLRRYDVIGFQEEVEDALQAVRRAAGLHRPFRNERLNRSRQRPPLEEVPEEVRSEIARVNFLDVRLYTALRELARGRPVLQRRDHDPTARAR